MNFYKSFTYGLNICMMTALFMTISLPVSANYCNGSQSVCMQNCPTPCPCQSADNCCFNRTGTFLGALAIGAAAGAGAGYLAGHNHKSCKNKCGSDLCICKKDVGQTLRFDIELSLLSDSEPITSLTCTPIVNTPSGCTISGLTTSQTPNALNATCLGEIEICDPECGTYHIGMNIDISPNTVLLQRRVLTVEVVASRTDQNANLQYNEVNDSSTFLSGPDVQTVVDYVYSPPCCVKTSCNSNN